MTTYEQQRLWLMACAFNFLIIMHFIQIKSNVVISVSKLKAKEVLLQDGSIGLFTDYRLELSMCFMISPFITQVI